MMSKISTYAAALGTAQCEDSQRQAQPAVEDTADASNEVEEGKRKEHSETCSSEADIARQQLLM